MIEDLTVRIATAIGVTAVATVVAGSNVLAPRVDRPPPPPPHQEEAPPDPRPEPRPEPDPAPRSPSDGRVDLGVDDDGAWFEMSGRDASGTTGGAGISMTDDGFHFELRQEGPEGSGGAGAAMTDEGMQLWFDVDQSQ